MGTDLSKQMTNHAHKCFFSREFLTAMVFFPLVYVSVSFSLIIRRFHTLASVSTVLDITVLDMTKEVRFSTQFSKVMNYDGVVQFSTFALRVSMLLFMP